MGSFRFRLNRREGGRKEGRKEYNTHPMQNKIPVAEFQSPKSHRHPALNIRRKKHK